MYRALVTDTLADSGLAILRNASDVELDYRPGLKGADLLGARHPRDQRADGSSVKRGE